MLQVAAELGIAGLATLFFLIGRAAMSRVPDPAPAAARRAASRRGRRLPERRRRRGHADEAEWFRGHAAAMIAALAGWFFCALFASVAYNWTFYYLLALATAPREILRRSARRCDASPREAAGGRVAFQEVRA